MDPDNKGESCMISSSKRANSNLHPTQYVACQQPPSPPIQMESVPCRCHFVEKETRLIIIVLENFSFFRIDKACISHCLFVSLFIASGRYTLSFFFLPFLSGNVRTEMVTLSRDGLV